MCVDLAFVSFSVIAQNDSSSLIIGTVGLVYHALLVFCTVACRL